MATVALSTRFFSQPSFPRSLALAMPSAPAGHVSVASHSHKSSPPALSQIQDSGIIACLRAPSAEMAKEAAHAALEGGISVLEIVVSTPGVFEVIQEIIHDHPSAVIGVGTVLNITDARNCVKSGAKFLMGPATVKEISEYFHQTEVLYIPGAMTPTEVFNAYKAGAKIVKVYPVSALGGAKYISALKKPFFHIPMVASQGITLDSIEAYISGGASAVVLSDAIFDKEAMRQKNFDAIYDHAYLATSHGYKAVNSSPYPVHLMHPYPCSIACDQKDLMQEKGGGSILGSIAGPLGDLLYELNKMKLLSKDELVGESQGLLNYFENQCPQASTRWSLGYFPVIDVTSARNCHINSRVKQQTVIAVQTMQYFSWFMVLAPLYTDHPARWFLSASIVGFV